MFRDTGKFLIGAGLLIALVGALMVLVPKTGIGRLPGDIVYRRGNFTFYFPIVSSILISIILSALLWVISRR